MTAPAVSMRGISKSFGAVAALRAASFELLPGEVHALLGENGAGKSTLMRVLFGLTRPDAGAIDVFGEPLAAGSTRAAMARGLGMVTQHFAQVPRLTVAQNLWLGRPGWRYDDARAQAAVSRVSEESGLALEPRALVGELPVGLRQRLEIVRALSRQVRVLILDEPTAALAPREVDDLFTALRRLVKDGLAVVLITHKLHEVAAIADRVTILRRGENVVTSAAARTMDARQLAAAMIGPDDGGIGTTSLLEVPATRARRAAPGEPALQVTNLTIGRAVRDVSFTLGSGEIVGIAAVEGNGQRELLRAVVGLVPHAGTVTALGGVGFIPEDRLAEGIIPELSLADNLALGRRTGFWIDRRQLERETESAIDTFRIAAGGPGSEARTLSGGNQQKLVLARVLGAAPKVVVAENPTRGLDVRSSAEVHALLRSGGEAKAGVLFWSADLDEVLALSDRVAVMASGRWHWVAEASRTRAAVGELMLGAAA